MSRRADPQILPHWWIATSTAKRSDKWAKREQKIRGIWINDAKTVPQPYVLQRKFFRKDEIWFFWLSFGNYIYVYTYRSCDSTFRVGLHRIMSWKLKKTGFLNLSVWPLSPRPLPQKNRAETVAQPNRDDWSLTVPKWLKVKKIINSFVLVYFLQSFPSPSNVHNGVVSCESYHHLVITYWDNFTYRYIQWTRFNSNFKGTDAKLELCGVSCFEFGVVWNFWSETFLGRLYTYRETHKNGCKMQKTKSV